MRAAPQSARAVEQAPAARGKRTNDALEHEADKIADTVVRGRFPDKIPPISPSSGAGGSRARHPLSVGQVLAQAGAPLGNAERAYFEPRFGRDLSGIRLHRDAAAMRSAADLAAQAYAFKNHIVLGSDAAGPGSLAGRQLLAHEISHTLQQRRGVAAIQRKPRPDAGEGDKDKPAVTSVTAEQGARTADVVLSDGSSASVELLINKLPPGDYVTSPVGRVPNPTAEGIPGKFIYRYPVDPYTEEPINGLASRTEIHIRPAPTAEVRQLPTEIREFVTSDRARPGTADEYRDAAYAGQILKEAGVTADELVLIQESRRHEREIGAASTEFGTQTDWAFDYIQKRQKKQLDQGSNWDALVELAKIMSDAPVHLLHHGGVSSILEEGSEALARVNYWNLVKFNKITPRSKQELYSTGARLLSEFRALIGHFETALVADLTNLAVAALDNAEASILRMDRQYVGMWQDKKWSANYFWNEVQRINRNEKVAAAARERDKVRGALEREQKKDDILRAINPLGVIGESLSGEPTYSQRTEQREKAIEQQNQAFNQAVSEQSNLKVSPGFSAENILAAKTPSDARSRLSDFLFYGRRQITRARGEINKRKVIYAADKIIDMEKERLKGALGGKSSEVSRVIDDLARYRKSQTSIWDDILKVVEFVSMFVPGPIGWGLRVGVAAINIDKRFTNIGTRRALYSGNLSAKSVGSGEVADALFEAAIQVVPDMPAVAKTERLTLNLERGAARSADDIAGVASRTASTAEHGAPQGLAGDVAGGAKVPEPPVGSGAPKPDLGVPTYSNLPGRVPKGGERVRIIEQDGKYFELDFETNTLTPASGDYSFARMQDGSLWGSRYGHAEASMGQKVGYAGQMKVEDGVLKRWSPESGTYRPAGGQFAEQAGFTIPPDPIPPHAGKKVQLPVFRPRAEPKVPAVRPDAEMPHWTDRLPEARRRTQASKAQHGDRLVLMATPMSADRQLIRELAARGQISPEEMQTFVEAVMREKPILGQLANAQRLTGEAQRAELLKILERAFVEDRLPYEVVADGVVQRATRHPGNVASVRAVPGRSILQIEESAFNSNSRLLAEVTHELAYFYGRMGGGFPWTSSFNGLQYLDWTIQRGGAFGAATTRRIVSSTAARAVSAEVNNTLKTLGVTEYDVGQFALGQKVFGQIERGGIEFTPYFIKEGDTLVAGVLSAASKGDPFNVIKAYLIFRKSAMDMARRLGAKTLRLEADVVVNTKGLIDSLLKRGFKLVDKASSKYALEIPL